MNAASNVGTPVRDLPSRWSSIEPPVLLYGMARVRDILKVSIFFVVMMVVFGGICIYAAAQDSEGGWHEFGSSVILIFLTAVFIGVPWITGLRQRELLPFRVWYRDTYKTELALLTNYICSINIRVSQIVPVTGGFLVYAEGNDLPYRATEITLEKLDDSDGIATVHFSPGGYSPEPPKPKNRRDFIDMMDRGLFRIVSVDASPELIVKVPDRETIVRLLA